MSFNTKFNINKFVKISAIALAMISIGGAASTINANTNVHADSIKQEQMKVADAIGKQDEAQASRDESYAAYQAAKTDPGTLAYDLEYAPDRIKGHKQELLNRLTPKQRLNIKKQMALDNGKSLTAPSHKNKYSHRAHKHVTHRHRAVKRNKSHKINRKRRITRHRKVPKYTRPTYKSGYNLGHSYGKFLGNLLGSNTSHKTLFNKTKAVYLNNKLSNRKYAKGFIKGYTYSASNNSTTMVYHGETRTSLASEARGVIKDHNKLIQHNYAYKLGFIRVMSYNDPNKVSNKMKHNKQYKLGVKLGQQEM